MSNNEDPQGYKESLNEKAPPFLAGLFKVESISLSYVDEISPAPAPITVVTIAKESKITTIPMTAYIRIFFALSTLS